jgi:hypothetical protein
MNISAEGMQIITVLTEEDVKRLSHSSIEGVLKYKRVLCGGEKRDVKYEYSVDFKQEEPVKVTTLPEGAYLGNSEKIFISVNEAYLLATIRNGIKSDTFEKEEGILVTKLRELDFQID